MVNQGKSLYYDLNLEDLACSGNDGSAMSVNSRSLPAPVRLPLHIFLSNEQGGLEDGSLPSRIIGSCLLQTKCLTSG